MSLQAVINPLEFMKKRTGFDDSRSLGEVTRERTNTPLKPGMLDYEAVMKKRETENMAQGISNEPIAAQMQANIKDRPVGVTGQRMNEMLRQIEMGRFKQGMDEDFRQNEMLRQKKAERIREAMEAPTIPNSGGFDPSDLMAAPAIRQEQTRNQANMVSVPYEQANRMAAEKTNPMNAASQEPGKVFLMKFIGKK